MDNAPNTDDPLGAPKASALEQHQNAALRALLITIGLAAPLITASVYGRDGLVPLVYLTGLLTLSVWAIWAIFLRGHARLAAHLIVAALVLSATAGMVVDGSVRSASVLAMMAALVLAGTFLQRRATVITSIICIATLGVLNLLEQQGHLSGRNLHMGLAVWIVQTAVILTIVVSIFYSRFRLIDALTSQEEALTHAHQVEAKLRASEARFMGLFRNTPAACLVQNMETRCVLDANEAFVKMFGYPREALLDQTPPTLWADAGEHLAFRARMQVEGRVSGMRAQALRSDGSSFEALLFSETIQQGTDRLVMSMTLDVSAEVASRQELAQSQERFSKAFNFSPVGTVICRLRDGTYLEANPSNQRVLGYSASELLGHTSTELNVWISQEDQRAYASQLHEQGQVLGFPTRLRNKQGEAVDVMLWSQVIELNGEVCELAYTINVTEERRREAMLMTVAEGVSTHTGEAYFLSAAEHLARAVGAQGVVIGELDAQNQLGTLALMQDAELQPNRTLPLHHTGYARLLLQDDLLLLDTRSQQIVQSCPPFDPDQMEAFAGVTLRDADGSMVGLLAVTWQRMPDYGESMQALLSIFASRCNAELLRLRRDREIRKLQETLEQRVAERTEQLEYLNQELETFSYSVSHDLKSPLRSMDGFMHLLREQMASRMTTEDEDLVDRIAASVTRMNSLINDLLALARVSQGQLQRMRVNLSELAEDVIRQERHRDPTREVEVVIAPGLMADCDPRLAHIVLENLLGNAWKYSRNQPKARIEMGVCADAVSGLKGFFVSDNGAGFDMSRADRLFKPFTRLHSPKEFEGSGIGLATVRRIIERHGGQIQGKGATGQGAMFCFSFGNHTV